MTSLYNCDGTNTTVILHKSNRIFEILYVYTFNCVFICFTGKTNTSVHLAKTYGAARLTIDGIVLEAISNGNTQVGRILSKLIFDKKFH